MTVFIMQVVYVARNPKDVIVSYYYHHKLIKLHGYIGTLDEFAEYFMNDEGESRSSAQFLALILNKNLNFNI